MCNLFVPVLCLVARLSLRKSLRVPDGATAALNGIVAHVARAAWPPGAWHSVDEVAAQFVPMLMPWLTLALATLAAWLTGCLLHRASRAGIGRPMSGLRNRPRRWR